ncbi:MAG: hypothetical protein II975_08035 [Bacteroidales bacterium]|nr:hypothetical protein [Bacteroidales bacterium]
MVHIKKLGAVLMMIPLLLISCEKESWKFNYPKDQLCSGWWEAVDVSTDGSNWTGMSVIEEQYSVRFYDDGSYSSLGSVLRTRSSDDYTYYATGNDIDILLDGERVYGFTVLSWVGTSMETKMTVEGSSKTIYYRFVKL